ncbi:MAG: Nicotinamide-nucleotide adenylyltransferase [Nitrosopumilales archaeon]|nr:MAG: Nicotinamide-nucleotide adenylyltransferase [Nitrosopumilales archaeon]
MRGLVMGRFQPFHLGHLELVKQVLSECGGVIIAVTGSQFNYIEKDPFTSGERIEMIHESLKEAEIDLSQCYVVSIENQENNAMWASYLKTALPRFEKVYSGNDYVSMLLADSGFLVVPPKFLEREKYNASKIREFMSQEKDWQSLVPQAVANVIKKIDGVARIQTIAKSDTKPQEF